MNAAPGQHTRSRRARAAAIACLAVTSLAGCSAAIQPLSSDKAQVEYKTQVYRDLKSLPPPPEPIVISAYRFRDDTGQYKPGTGTVGWSTAVTQGATAMLVKALQDAGNGRWFTVLEREHLSDLLNERKIIRQTREQYGAGEGAGNGPSLPPLLFAPLLVMGGIVGYESDLLTGGIGARYLGIGGSAEYRRDTVTVYLRAVSVKNGAIVRSVMTSKTIFSVAVQGGAFKFVAFKELLEVEAGFTTNEPPQMAVLEAIEKGVHSLVMEGVLSGLWRFADADAGVPLVQSYLAEKAVGRDGRPAGGGGQAAGESLALRSRVVGGERPVGQDMSNTTGTVGR